MLIHISIMMYVDPFLNRSWRRENIKRIGPC